LLLIFLVGSADQVLLFGKSVMDAPTLSEQCSGSGTTNKEVWLKPALLWKLWEPC